MSATAAASVVPLFQRYATLESGILSIYHDEGSKTKGTPATHILDVGLSIVEYNEASRTIRIDTGDRDTQYEIITSVGLVYFGWCCG